MNRKLATKTKNIEYLFLIIGLIMSFIAGFIGLIYGDFKTGLLMLIICTLVLFFIGHFSIQYNWRNELKIDILECINDANAKIPYTWFPLTVYDYLKFRYIYSYVYDIVKNKNKTIKYITGVNPMRFKKETIEMFVFSKIPDNYILNNDNTIWAVIRFSNEIDAEPFIYDVDGNFLGKIMVDGFINSIKGDFITNSTGLYTHRLLKDMYSHFYKEPITTINTTRFKPMPNITFTNDEIENFKKPIVKI